MELLWLFLEFFKIGLFTFGGGYAMIPLVKETVLQHNWISEVEFYNLIGICESTPGPIAINMATFIGSFTNGFLGSLLATIGVVLPSFIIILLIAALLSKFLENKNVGYFIDGIKPIIIGLIFSAGLILCLKSLGYESLQVFNFNFRSLTMIIILIIIFVTYRLILKKNINTILFIVLSAGIGILTNIIFDQF